MLLKMLPYAACPTPSHIFICDEISAGCLASEDHLMNILSDVLPIGVLQQDIDLPSGDLPY